MSKYLWPAGLRWASSPALPLCRQRRHPRKRRSIRSRSAARFFAAFRPSPPAFPMRTTRAFGAASTSISAARYRPPSSADPDKVEFVPLNTNVRFQALQSGEVDILSRQNTWSFSRDTSLGLDFGPVVFYDGQGLMVPAKLNVKSASGAHQCRDLPAARHDDAPEPRGLLPAEEHQV